MIYVGLLKVDQSLATRTRAILQSPEGVERAIAFLRSEGESKISTIRMLIVTAGLSLRVSKRLVHQSPTWQDRREADDSVHESLALAVASLPEADADLVRTGASLTISTR